MFVNCVNGTLQGVLDILTEKTFTREKLSKLLAELAKRDWPQRWPNFTSILMQYLKTGVGCLRLNLRDHDCRL